MKSRSPIAWAALDLAACLILVIYVLIAPPPKKHTPPSIATLGLYAVTATWSDNSNDDVDLYVQAPGGRVVYYANPNAEQMQLEHDDIGCAYNSGYLVGHTCKNYERIVLRQTEAGEYIVNVNMFVKRDKNPQPVTVQLYRLAGHDKLVRTDKFTLVLTGDEKTAYRFTVDAQGKIIGYSNLPKSLATLVLTPNGDPTTPYSPVPTGP